MWFNEDKAAADSPGLEVQENEADLSIIKKYTSQKIKSSTETLLLNYNNKRGGA